MFRFSYNVLCFFLYLLKTSEKKKISDFFEGYMKRPVTWNGIRATKFGHMRRFARFVTICTIQKHEKHPRMSVTFNKVETCKYHICILCTHIHRQHLLFRTYCFGHQKLFEVLYLLFEIL